MTSEVGIPAKKSKFDLAGEDIDNADCKLYGSELYVIYNVYDKESKITNPHSACLKKINLNTFDGDETRAPSIYSVEGLNNKQAYGYLIDQAGAIVVSGDPVLLIDKKTSNILINENQIDSDDSWSRAGIKVGFIFEENYYRVVDFENSEKGIDVYNINDKKIIDHLDIDINCPALVYEFGLIIGSRKNGNLAIYSIRQKKILLELSLPGHGGPGVLRFDLIDMGGARSRLAVICGNAILVVNLSDMKITHEINYLNSSFVQNFTADYLTKIQYCYANSISGAGDLLAVSGGASSSYVMLLDLSKSDPIQWLYGNYYDVISYYAGGDLIFGIDKSRPVAWDVFSGEKVWEASSGTIANTIQIGGQWVVYHQLCGYIRCFQWKKPYISPHRPK